MIVSVNLLRKTSNKKGPEVGTLNLLIKLNNLRGEDMTKRSCREYRAGGFRLFPNIAHCFRNDKVFCDRAFAVLRLVEAV